MTDWDYVMMLCLTQQYCIRCVSVLGFMCKNKSFWYVPQNGKSGTRLAKYVPENAKLGTHLYSWIKTIYSINRRKNNGSGLESYREGDVELAACQIVGNGVLQVVDVGDPVAAAHVWDVSCWVTSWEFAEHHAYKLTPSVVALQCLSVFSSLMIFRMFSFGSLPIAWAKSVIFAMEVNEVVLFAKVVNSALAFTSFFCFLFKTFRTTLYSNIIMNYDKEIWNTK